LQSSSNLLSSSYPYADGVVTPILLCAQFRRPHTQNPHAFMVLMLIFPFESTHCVLCYGISDVIGHIRNKTVTWHPHMVAHAHAHVYCPLTKLTNALIMHSCCPHILCHFWNLCNASITWLTPLSHLWRNNLGICQVSGCLPTCNAPHVAYHVNLTPIFHPSCLFKLYDVAYIFYRTAATFELITSTSVLFADLWLCFYYSDLIFSPFNCFIFISSPFECV